jgi:hypothetical protein
LFGSSSQTSTSSSHAAYPSSSVQANGQQMRTSTSSTFSPSKSKPSNTQKDQQAGSDQLVPSIDSASSGDHHVISEKVAKAYEFLKDEKPLKPAKNVRSELKGLREEGRMQAYGWSLPKRDSSKTSSSSNLSVPVPVYCRPLFEQDNNLKLSCASTVDFTYDAKICPDFDDLISSCRFSHFKSINGTADASPVYKSSCIWICNLNDNDTHVSILDSNRPSDILYQFTIKNIKVYCIQTVPGVKQIDLLNEHSSITNLNVDELNRNLMDNRAMDSEYPNLVQCTNPSIRNENIQILNEKPSLKDEEIEAHLMNSTRRGEKHLNMLYPTMWLGSQDGYLIVHSSINDVSTYIASIKLKDAVLTIVHNQAKVFVGLADGSLAIFKRDEKGSWDLRNYYLINFDKPHHSIRCLNNVEENLWCACRNKIFIFNTKQFKILNVIEAHPRKENQVRHIVSVNQGVWVSIRLDSTLRLYHAKTYQLLQYLDIEPFITKMLGTSNLGLSLIRISSLLIDCKRIWIGTGNGVILSIPFNEELAKSANNHSFPGSVVRTNDQSLVSDGAVPYCNIADAQFSFHGHRDSIKFFLSVPSQVIQKAKPIANEQAVESSVSKSNTYQNVEAMLILSGGHGYIDFRIGDSSTSSSASNEKKLTTAELVEMKADEKTGALNSNSKTDRSHLIVWQISSCN